MKYDEDLMIELIADGELSHEKIAEQLGVSRRTVWLIANGHSRPDLQQKIADTLEGYRQAVIRRAAGRMDAVLDKQIEVALEGDGETARKAREFLLKTFMLAIPEQAAKAAARPKPPSDHNEKLDALTLFNNLMDLSPDAEPPAPSQEEWNPAPLPTAVAWPTTAPVPDPTAPPAAAPF